MTPSELRKGLNDLEKRYPKLTVKRDYDGAGVTGPGEPAPEADLWPTCDKVLADWYGCDPADVSEWMTENNWKATEDDA